MSLAVRLNRLFESFGYRRFRMSKFEEYDLYAENRDFLTSSQIITFNDLDGKLLALKPDITLSIIKSTSGPRKVYYNEMVSPFKGSFAQDTPILHVQGRNIGMGAYMDCAIIDCEEPIGIVVYVESAYEENAYTVMQQIARYTAEFVRACYS